jgi:hypothetical protein
MMKQLIFIANQILILLTVCYTGIQQIRTRIFLKKLQEKIQMWYKIWTTFLTCPCVIHSLYYNLHDLLHSFSLVLALKVKVSKNATKINTRIIFLFIFSVNFISLVWVLKHFWNKKKTRAIDNLDLSLLKIFSNRNQIHFWKLLKNKIAFHFFNFFHFIFFHFTFSSSFFQSNIIHLHVCIIAASFDVWNFFFSLISTFIFSITFWFNAYFSLLKSYTGLSLLLIWLSN